MLRTVCLLLLLFPTTLRADGVLELEKGDRVCLVGNELGERMQHQNFWETLLHQRFPERELVVRNLCHPGDEVAERLRTLNFGDPHQHLTHSKASVVLFFFGFNESFDGKHGVERFERELVALAEETKTKDYSGDGPPRIVFVSPIAFENTGNPHLPDGREHNARIAMYAAAMERAARKSEVGFVDVFTPTKELFERSDARLRFTRNGSHLNERGYEAFAQILDRGLFGRTDARPKFPEGLRDEIADKNFHWWHRYRAVNGYSIWGTRGKAGSDGTYDNTAVMERERAILDQMTANRDTRIWSLAQGDPVPVEVDDSNTLPFIQPKTNVGGENDPNRKRGKLGSLDYRPAREQEKLFTLAPGYAINLVASEEDFPELANPVALNFDAKGRLWVSTMPSYPQWKPKTKLDDKLLILEDHDGDGRADECKVFAGGLHQPTGFELGQGGAFVANQQDILFLKDTDGDDRADVRERKLVGFDTADSHHGIAAFEWGPGGNLYFQEGTFKQSQVESPYGLTRLSDAGTWRYHPRSHRFGVHVSLAFANPWGHVFDKYGQNFIADASPGQNFWATPISGHVSYPDKHPGGARAKGLDWGGSKSKATYPTFLVKRTRPSSGCEIVASRHFPDDAQGNFLQNNVIGDLAVLNHTMKDDGAGFGGEEVTPLVSCKDGNFRPVDLQFGPDGALYIVDWHNALIGHLQHNLREPHRDTSHGRIWRITYPSRPLVDPPKIAGEPVAKLLDLLKLPEDRTRYRVRREIAARGRPEVLPEVGEWSRSLDADDPQYEHHLLEALWVHQAQDVVNPDLLTSVMNSTDPRVRAAAVRVASFWHDRVDLLALVEPRVHDDHPRVRLEAVRACSFVFSPESFELVLGALEHDTDKWLDYTITETLRILEDEINAIRDREEPVEGQRPPIVFLDKSPQVVDLQLARMTNAQLTAIEADASEKRFEPVFAAILRRPGVSANDRRDALAGLTEIRGSSPIGELLDVLPTLPRNDRSTRAASDQLGRLLMAQPKDDLVAVRDRLRTMAQRGHGAAMGGLLVSGDAEWVDTKVWKEPKHGVAFLDGVRLLPKPEMRNAYYDRVEWLAGRGMGGAPRNKAIRTLGLIPGRKDETFHRLANYTRNDPFRAAAVAALSTVPEDQREETTSRKILVNLTTYAEATPAAKRTTQEFLDAMQLADSLLSRIPADEAKAFRDRLREVAVRVVVLNTVEEEMRYDKPFFVVEAGRSVQLVLRNEDLMPHNLVVTKPGAMKEVALLAQDLPPTIGKGGLQYTPKSDLVVQAMPMVAPHGRAVITFTAPSEPGEYPYVCTFPRHWMRMYGVMLVVPDLAEYRANPTKPADPLGLDREFVKAWTPGDFPDLDQSLRGRSPEIGARIFEQASCLQCHQVRGKGGKVGPDLTDVMKRRKGDRRIVLREILDPSHEVDPKYTLYNVVTDKGLVISGIVTKQDRQQVTLVTNPEKPEPVTVDRDDVDQMIKTSASIMPKGLLNRFTKDEVLELLSYVTAAPGDGSTGP